MPMAAVGTPTTPVGGPATVPTSGNTPSANANNATSAPITAKTWELSDYELQRTPQEAITDDTEIAISPRALHSELMCPICLDMLHQTMTTKECLHRFCCECIVTALRSGNKECPTCRKKLVSKRSLRPDPNFDELIANIYPSRDEYEAQQQKALANLSKSHNQLALATSIEVGMKAQSQVRKIQKANPKSNVEGTESLASAAQLQTGDQPVVSGSQNPSEDVAPNIRPGNAAGVPAQTSVSGNKNGTALPQNATTSAGAMKSSNIVVAESNSDNTSNASGSGMTDEISEIELVFKPHPDMQVGTTGTPPVGLPTEHIQTRFIKTSGNATVEHLRKYLGMRLALDSDSGENEEGPLRNCSIWISTTQGNYMKVPVGLTLGQVCDKYWKLNKPLEVYYFWKKI